MKIHHRRSPALRRLGCQAFVWLWAVASLHAQVIRDGSIGPAASPLTGPNYQIPATLGERKGGNLFHSFQKFDLQIGDSATFSADGARNILARVTDRTPSSINGAINADANLFLMNPAGIVFHENATINVNGSFFATTADYIKLGPSGQFAATTNARDSILTVSDPSAFGFLAPAPAAIQVNRSKFLAPSVKTLAFVAGDVAITGGAHLQAEDVQIVSVRAAGEAALQLPTDTNGLRYPTINSDTFVKRGAVTVGSPSVQGEPPPPRASITANRVVIRGGTLVVKNADVRANANNSGDGVSMQAANELTVGDHSVLTSRNTADFRGQATIDISAHSASIETGSQIYSATIDPGSGGDVRLNVDGTLSIRGGASIVTQSNSLDRGGDIHVSAGNLFMDDSVLISQGDALAKSGDILLEVAGSLSLTGGAAAFFTITQSSNEQIVATAQNIAISGPGSGFFFLDQSLEGTGGSISVTARGSLSILDGGLISAGAVSRPGASVTIHAGDVLISAAGTPGLPTGVIASTLGGLGTRGGDIHMDVAGLLQVLDGGMINTNTQDQGNAGNIVIHARDALVTGPATPTPFDLPIEHGITAQNLPLTADSPSGDSGSIQLTLTGSLEMRDGGAIIVDTRGAGRGGDINISANQMLVSSGGIVAARTFAEGGGRGGDLTIDISGRLDVAAGGQLNAGTFGSGAGGTISIRGNEIVMSGENARISAVSGGPQIPATGAGGNVLLTAADLQIGNDAQITASTFGPGAGGNVAVTANSLSIADNDGEFFAGISAQTLNLGTGGPGGTVQVEARSLALRGAGAAITTQSLGAGNSGQVRVATDTLVMNDHSMIQSSSTGAGNAGSIMIDAQGDITLHSGSSLSVAAAQSNAGDISVRSGTSITLTDSSIIAQAAVNGGNIDVRSQDMLFLSNSQITAAAGGNGGNIFIDPTFVILDQSLISANAIVGRGGNIRIISDFFLGSNSLVTATSQLGIDGTVHIDALNTDLTGSLIELPSSLINAESLLQELCTVKVDKFSSFISEGRGGLPPLPGEALPSLMIVQ